jgi:hypothetical protein
LAPYAIVIRAFTEGRISAREFEALYLTLFKHDDRLEPGKEFDVLDALFGDVDAFSDDEDVRVAVGGIDEDQLRQRASTALARLDPGRPRES